MIRPYSHISYRHKLGLNRRIIWQSLFIILINTTTWASNDWQIIHNAQSKFTINNVGEYVEEGRLDATLLGPDSKSSHIVLPYSDHIIIKDVELKIKRGSGSINKIKKKDFEIINTTPATQLHGDNMALHYHCIGSSYPIKIELYYKILHRTNFIIDLWSPFQFYTKIEKQSLEVIVPQGIKVNSHISNFDPDLISIDTTQYKDQLIFTWTITDFKGQEKKSFATPLQAIYPSVFIQTSNFEHHDRKGCNDTWKSLGQFFYKINANRIKVIPDNDWSFIDTSNRSSDILEKVNSTFSWLQSNMRYVSVQLGIGGFIAMNGKDVSKKRYGDCKALTYFMSDLLDIQGINSNPVAIHRGGSKVPLDTSFAFNYFNHMILYVPDIDSYLECTSKKYPSGYIGNDNQNKWALHIKDGSSKLMKTPSYNNSIHAIKSNSIHILNDSLEWKTVRTDTFRHNYHDVLLESSLSEDTLAFVDFICSYTNFDKINLKSINIKFNKTLHYTVLQSNWINCISHKKVGHSRIVIHRPPTNTLENTLDEILENAGNYHLDENANFSSMDSIILPDSWSIINESHKSSLPNINSKYSKSTKSNGNTITLSTCFLNQSKSNNITISEREIAHWPQEIALHRNKLIFKKTQ